MLRVSCIGSCLSLTLLAACDSQSPNAAPSGPTFAYVLDPRSPPWRTVLSIYRVDGPTGAWSLVSTLPPRAEAGTSPPDRDVASVSLDPKGRFLIAALAGSRIDNCDYCAADRNLVTYKIDPSSGALSMTSTKTLFLHQPPFVAVHPSSRFLLLEEYPGCSIHAAGIDSMTGALGDTLSDVGCGGEYEQTEGDDWVAVEPTGRFVYYGSCYLGGAATPVFGYQMDAVTGSLHYLGQWAAGKCFAVDPSGRHLYGSMSGTGPSGHVAQFDIDDMNGNLTAMGRTPSPGNPTWLVVHPSGRFLYVASGPDVVAYRLDDAGVPSLIGIVASGVTENPPYATPTCELVFDPAGRFLYVLRPGDVLGHSVNATTGDLQPIHQAEGGKLGAVAARGGILNGSWIGLATPSH
jgi:6-phosphogluconolactonase (cycloisomerase 2 family)